MTTVRATCRNCGDIVLTPLAVTVSSNSWRFNCPHCTQRIAKAASPATVRLLAVAGCIPDLDDTDAVWAELETAS